MKFGKVGQVGLVSAIALLVATLFTACSTLTVGFLFVATNKQTPGQIEVYEINSESGVLRTIPTSPFPSGGRDPIAEVAGTDFKNLYVVNQDDNNVVQFAIGSDGKLYPQSTINTPGSFPLAATLNSAGTYFYVVDTLQPTAGCTLTNPCPGVIAGYATTPATSTILPGSLGLQPAACSASTAPSAAVATTCTTGNPIVNGNGLGYLPLQLTPGDNAHILTPTAINILSNGQYVYVTAYDAAALPTAVGYLFAFSAGSDGTLTALNGGVPYQLAAQDASGTNVPLTQPVAMVSDSSSSNLYVVDKATNRVAVYTPQSTGVLNTLTGTTVATTSLSIATGNLPSAVALENDKFLYVTNSLDSNISAYTVNSGSIASIGTYTSDDNPIAVITDPRHLGFLYTVNFLGNSLSGYQSDPTAGTLINTKNTPYVSTAQPTAVAGIPHGGTATK